MSMSESAPHERAARPATYDVFQRACNGKSTGGQPSPCEDVQKELEKEELLVKAAMAEELHGKVDECIKSKHAHHVIQKCIEVLPAEDLKFIIEEVIARGSFETANHKYGNRVIQRLLEYVPHEFIVDGERLMDKLINEVVAGNRADEICSQEGDGNFVLQKILEEGTPEWKRPVKAAVCRHITLCANSQQRSFLVEFAMGNGSEEDTVAQSLLEETNLGALAMNLPGSKIVRQLLFLTGDASQQALTNLKNRQGEWRETTTGKHVSDCMMLAERIGYAKGLLTAVREERATLSAPLVGLVETLVEDTRVWSRPQRTVQEIKERIRYFDETMTEVAGEWWWETPTGKHVLDEMNTIERVRNLGL